MASDYLKSGRTETFGMPFTKREVAAIVANELNRHDRGLWFYEVKRHIDDRRWIVVREEAFGPALSRSTLPLLSFASCSPMFCQASQAPIGRNR